MKKCDTMKMAARAANAAQETREFKLRCVDRWLYRAILIDIKRQGES